MLGMRDRDESEIASEATRDVGQSGAREADWQRSLAPTPPALSPPPLSPPLLPKSRRLFINVVIGVKLWPSQTWKLGTALINCP